MVANRSVPSERPGLKIVTSKAMAEIDRRTIDEFGIPSSVLMENAGMRLWNTFISEFALKENDLSRIVFLAGSGNNGGDACVMARQARTEKYHNIHIISFSTTINSDRTGQKAICKGLGISLVQWKDERAKAEALIGEADFIIDGLAGTGLMGAASGEMEQVINSINRSNGVKISVDIPSGLGDDFKIGFPCVNADTTYTIGLPLCSLYLPGGRLSAGNIRIVPICFPRVLMENEEIPGELVEWADCTSLLPFPGRGGYKGVRGHVQVYAGSVGTTGAAWLSSHAAARSLAGLVTLNINSNSYSSMAGSCRGVMILPWDPESEPEIPKRVDSFLVGPGWGTDRMEFRRKWLRTLMGENTPGVLDADGLRVFGSGDGFEQLNGNWIFTPHPGEFASMTGLTVSVLMEDPLSYITAFAVKWNLTLVLKSHVVYIAHPDGRYTIIDGMNPSLGTGGSGDILGGIIAGFLAAGAESEEAAVAGVGLHQELGRRGRKANGWFIAEDLVPIISRIISDAEDV